jgi:YesN/AraC family two-component response regulator
MSGDGETDVVMKGITHGACDYLLKPVRLEELRNIWQHVVRKRVTPRDTPKEELSGEWDESAKPLESDPTEYEQTSSRKRKEKMEDDYQVVEDMNNLKKARVVWSVELHQQFVNAVHQLGVDSKL